VAEKRGRVRREERADKDRSSVSLEESGGLAGSKSVSRQQTTVGEDFMGEERRISKEERKVTRGGEGWCEKKGYSLVRKERLGGENRRHRVNAGIVSAKEGKGERPYERGEQD